MNQTTIDQFRELEFVRTHCSMLVAILKLKIWWNFKRLRELLLIRKWFIHSVKSIKRRKIGFLNSKLRSKESMNLILIQLIVEILRVLEVHWHCIPNVGIQGHHLFRSLHCILWDIIDNVLWLCRSF